jgi:tRNA nucleotidyltransferase/poly(A) polymerase
MFTFFEIGGKIRDELLGLPSKDIDYVAVPNIEINEVLHRFDYKNKFAVVSTERIREELHKAFKVNTNMTLYYLNKYYNLSDYIFTKTNLWLKPTTEL